MSKKNNSLEKFIDKTCKNDKGKVVLLQSPNLIAWIWIVANILMIFVKGDFYKFLEIISFGSLFTWCWLEITEGVNYFRKGLGIIILVIAITNRMY